MKMNRGFITGVVVFLLLVFIAEMRMPAHFVWEPSFRHGDRQPFGCYAADSLLAASLPGGYSVTDKTLYQLSREKTNLRRSYVVLCEDFAPAEVEFRSMLRLLERGDNVMLLVYSYGGEFNDSIFGVSVQSYDYVDNFKSALRYYGTRDTLSWIGDSARYPHRMFIYDSPLVRGHLDVSAPSRVDVLAVIEDYGGNNVVLEYVADQAVDTAAVVKHRLPCAVSVTYGKGRLVICPYPLFFTNYGMLETGNHDFVFRLYAQLGSRPVVRTESVLKSAGDIRRSGSPLAYFLRCQPLRWAIYTAVAGVLLYFFFSARRRQRVIPVIKAPANKSLEFVRLIGTLYHQRHDNTGLVRRKYLYFTDTLRREMMADIGNAGDDGRSAALIAGHTGMDEREILACLHELRVAVDFKGNMSDAQMKRCIDMMNKIILRL